MMLFLICAVIAVVVLLQIRKKPRLQESASFFTADERDGLITRIENITNNRIPLANGFVTGCIGGKVFIWRDDENMPHIVCQSYLDNLARQTLSQKRKLVVLPNGRVIYPINSPYDHRMQSLCAMMFARNRAVISQGNGITIVPKYRSPHPAKCEKPCCATSA